MSNGIFGIGVSGLYAAQAGLLTTGHNISNVNTPGYSRQQIIQTTQTPQYTGSGYLGQGTNVSTVQRIYSSFLASQTFQQQAGASHLDTYDAQVSQLNNLLGDSTTGVAPALSDFFSGINAVAANPADVAFAAIADFDGAVTDQPVSPDRSAIPAKPHRRQWADHFVGDDHQRPRGQHRQPESADRA